MTVSRETGATRNLPLTPEDVACQVPMSDETLDRLGVYADVLTRWARRINLVGPSTLPDLWRRHFLDSAQLHAHLPPGPLLDLGSGAGFPGLVLAIMRGTAPVTDRPDGATIHLVESDLRKCAFLREAARLTEAQVEIHACRIEDLAPFPVAAVTSRALAPLSRLLELAENFLYPSTILLFPKGRGGEEELTEAGKEWRMTVQRISSLTDPSGVIFHLKEVCRGRDQDRPR